jgi:cell wall-associated NlpC family hydrolase
VHELSSRRRSRLSAGTGKIALTLGLCLCAGQLVATPASAATGTIAPVTAAVATTALRAAGTPRFGFAASSLRLKAGATTRVTAKLTDPKTGKAVRSGSVRLQLWSKGTWRTWQTKRLSTSGQVVFTARPAASSSVRAQFTGTTGYRAAVSRMLNIRVQGSGSKVITEAKRHTGAAYRFGASGPRSFDCSGFTMYVFRKAAGKQLPHKANLQQRYGRAVSKSQARPGDLIVVRSGSYGTHAGIYAGNGYMYAAPRAGRTVGMQKIWSRSYVVRRLV